MRSATTMRVNHPQQLAFALTDAQLRLSGTHCRKLSLIVTLLLFLSLGWRHSSSPGLSFFRLLGSTLPGSSASELWPYSAIQMSVLLVVVVVVVVVVVRYFCQSCCFSCRCLYFFVALRLSKFFTNESYYYWLSMLIYALCLLKYRYTDWC